MLLFQKKFTIVLMSAALLCSSPLFGETKSQANKGAKTAKKQEEDRNRTAVKANATDSEDGYTAVASTRIDFSETAIDGKMKAPDGFLLQSRQSSSLSQMVKLRSNFRNELNNSKSATKALVK